MITYYIMEILLPEYGIQCAFISTGLLVLAGFSALVAALSSQQTNLVNQEMQEKQNQYNTAEAQKQRDFELQMQEQQNQFAVNQAEVERNYNTPSAQLARLRSAGINPFIGQNSIGASDSTVASPSSAPSGASASSPLSALMQNPFESANSSAMSLAQMYGIDAQAGNQMAQRDKTAVEVAKGIYDITGSKQSSQDYLFNQLGRMESGDSPYMRQALADVNSRELQNQYQKLQNELSAKYGAKSAESRIANIEMDTTRKVAEIGRMASENRLNEQKIKELASQMVANYAKAGLDLSNTNTVNALRSGLVAQLNLQNSGQSLINYNQSMKNTILGYDKEDRKAQYLYDTPKRDMQYDTSRYGFNYWKQMFLNEVDNVISERISTAVGLGKLAK